MLIRGSSYIKLPEWIAKMKAVIIPKISNEKCFKWVAVAALGTTQSAYLACSIMKTNVTGSGLSFC